MSAELVPPRDDELCACRDLLVAGRVRDALVRALGQTAVEVARQRAEAWAMVMECRLARGELQAAAQTAGELRPLQDEPGATGAHADQALGELATAYGDHDSAAVLHTEAGRKVSGADDDALALPWRAGAALAMTRLGWHRDAQLLAHAHLAHARRHGSPYAVAQALRTVATTDPGSGREALLREARQVLDGCVAERLAAQLDTDLAVLLSLRADPGTATTAVALLRGAEAYAVREDLAPLHQRVRSQLERWGEAAQPIRRESLTGLTTTEQRAAELAAGGLKNREIATAMQVTVKAVEWHLSHVYRKLGIPGRGELAEALGASV
jgi:ATP/maltotriose-dependent transcriptional regulator MalT